MLRDALFLIQQDLFYLLRRRETLLWTFVMPIIFFYFIGNVAGGFGRANDPDPIAVVAPADAGFLKDELIKRLEQRNFRAIQQQDFFRELRIPAGFTASVLAGKAAKVEFIRHGANVNSDYDQTRINRAVYTVLADFTAISSKGTTPTPEAFATLAKQPRTISVDISSAGKRKVPPIGFEQAVPGILVMFTLQVLLTVGGVSISAERRAGILRRLASSPMSRSSVVLGKWGARMALGFIQILFAMATGTILFRVHWGDHLGAILLLLASYAGFTAVLGLLLGNVARNEGQLIGIAVISSNMMAALGGCWWPIEITPPFAQKLALVFPTGWAMDALHKLMSFGDSPLAVLPHIAAFVAATLIAGYVLARTFRFQ
ncbi:MAG TPA: ABC transporter permease [Bryobacteraceae bacterium]|nr:ABC transporter permease [Bryobacteraceae bacterium]